MEAIYLHILNVVILQLVIGQKQWHVVGCYIDPNKKSTIEDVVTAIRRKP